MLEDLFIDPNYRKMGVATKLITHAISIAKQKGATKIHLNVELDNNNAIKFYNNLGFREIVRTILGQKILPGSAPSKIIKRIIVAQEFMTKLALQNSRLVPLQTKPKTMDMLYKIHQRYVDQKTIDFLEIDPRNIIYGSRCFWQPLSVNTVLFNNRQNAFSIISNAPFSYKATVEVYSDPSTFTSMLDDILTILEKRGLTFPQITLFNSDYKVMDWFHKSRMMIFQFIVMGKTI